MAIKRIFSAGGIVIRPSFVKTSEGEQDEEGPRVLVTQHSKHKGWDFPKGHIENGESAGDAAIREVSEETGVRAEIISKIGQTQYYYWEEMPFVAGALQGKRKVFKTVTFFLMKHIDQGEATTAYEVSGTKWLPVDRVSGQLTFKDTKDLWEKAKLMIESLG